MKKPTCLPASAEPAAFEALGVPGDDGAARVNALNYFKFLYLDTTRRPKPHEGGRGRMDFFCTAVAGDIAKLQRPLYQHAVEISISALKTAGQATRNAISPPRGRL